MIYEMQAEVTPRQLEIIEAAGKILTTSGVSGLTIKNIAREMHFSESAIYRHFTSKEEIILAMLSYLADTMDARLARVSAADQPQQDKFKALFEEFFALFSQHPHFVVAVFSDGLMEESQRINQAIFKIMTVKMKYLMPVILQGQQQGVFTQTITTEELMHIVMGAIRLLMFKWRLSNFQFDLMRQGDNLLQALLTLIKNK